MCRHIGYIGEKNTLYTILLKHDHNLLKLAYQPIEMQEAILNADGYGIAWENNKKFSSYKNCLPIWNDLNLNSLSKAIYSKIVIGNVRSATLQENLGYFNTHPFHYKNYCFSHNGYINNFNLSKKRRILKILEDKYFNLLKGNTDSELLFVLLMQYIEKFNDIEKSINEIIKVVDKNFSASMLNFLLATIDKNGNKILFATKYAKNLKPPSLYYIKTKKNNFYISSEKLNNRNWINIQNNSLVKILNDNIQIKSLK